MGRRKTVFPDLAAEMRRNGETQSDLSNLLGFNSNSPISQRMTGKTEFTLNEVECICSHYGKPCEILFKRKGA